MFKFNPDTTEKIQTNIAMSTMFIKIIMASFPMLFVPQKCGTHVCSMVDKITGWHVLSTFNFATFLLFLRLYYVQKKRENFLIEYFDEDDQVAEDELTKQIEKFPVIKKEVCILNHQIRVANSRCIWAFVFNSTWSILFILIMRYLDATTITVLLTNSLLVSGKLDQIRQSYLGDDLAQSTVQTVPKVFNVIDKDYILKEDHKDIEIIELTIEDDSLGTDEHKNTDN